MVIVLVLLDVFLTVLYARVGTGVVSDFIGGWTWAFFKGASRLFGPWRKRLLSFCGPVILVLLIATWGIGLTLGSALVIHPQLGRSIFATDGSTSTDFGTAIFVAGNSLAIVGASDFTPKTRLFHWYFFANSLVGMSMMTLILTYVLQVYTALHNRNAFALKTHIAAAEKADAAEIVAGLGPRGQFDKGYSSLVEMAGELIHVKESHHFYPVVFYFRFSESYYSVSQFSLMIFDCVSLLRSALHDDDYAWLKESGVVSQLGRTALLLVKTLCRAFVREVVDPGEFSPDAETMERWRQRYRLALQCLGEAGISTADPAAGEERYITLRSEWNPYILKLARYGAYQMEEIDPRGYGKRQ